MHPPHLVYGMRSLTLPLREYECWCVLRNYPTTLSMLVCWCVSMIDALRHPHAMHHHTYVLVLLHHYTSSVRGCVGVLIALMEHLPTTLACTVGVCCALSMLGMHSLLSCILMLSYTTTPTC